MNKKQLIIAKLTIAAVTLFYALVEIGTHSVWVTANGAAVGIVLNWYTIVGLCLLATSRSMFVRIDRELKGARP